MFTKSVNLLKITVNKTNYVTKSSLHLSSCSKEKWDLLAAVCLERKPVITPALNDLEKEYKAYMESVEFERSLKSDTELKLEFEKKQLELLKGGNVEDIDISLKQTQQDFIDLCTEELAKFKPADRITEADKKNDVRSLNRKLDRHLVLVTNQKIGDKNLYILPQDRRQEGETLRQAAERILKKSCSDIKAQIYGNGPFGFYKYKYPLNARSEVVGAKVFIYFARYKEGQLPQTEEYKWLDRQELEKLLPPQYNKSIQQMLIDN